MEKITNIGDFCNEIEVTICNSRKENWSAACSGVEIHDYTAAEFKDRYEDYFEEDAAEFRAKLESDCGFLAAIERADRGEGTAILTNDNICDFEEYLELSEVESNEYRKALLLSTLCEGDITNVEIID